jgi:UDP-N-acetylglucosamine acyltransferase
MAKNRIDPKSLIVGDVRLGEGNVIEAGAIIIGPVEIGDGNYFGPMSIIGAPPEDDILADVLRTNGLASHPEGGIAIGNRNVFREFTTLHRGLTGVTVVGSDCYVMAHAHIGHDCQIRDGAKIADTVQMGGYSWIGRGTYLGLSATLHQFSVIGAYSMIGMGSVLTLREVPIGSLLHGNPARLIRPNAVRLEELGVTDNGWWEGLRDGSGDAGVPAELRADLAEFDRACEWARKERAAVTEWRNARRSHRKTD